jgi:aspartyl-tRNA(Asn)/glutamyl-tRNA(Gln) amidotransferase subunit C
MAGKNACPTFEAGMALTRADVEKVSLLGRLLLSEAELDTMTTQLGRVVGYVEQLSEVKTDNVQPMAHALDMQNVFRDDVLRPSLPRDAALANAPKRDSECYSVPAVLGE